jgi:peroxiredoxin
MKTLMTLVVLAAITLLPARLDAAVAVGASAPAFTLTNSAGDVVNLAEYKGKHVVLEWINFDCPFVAKFYKAGKMQELQASYKQQDVVWLSIASSATGKQGYFDGKALSARKAKEQWAGSHYLIDADGTVGRAYQATNTPQMVIIDPQGTVQYMGAIDSIRSANPADIPKATNFVDAGLQALLKGQTPADIQTKPYGCSIKYR